jgi:hypothetical protein
MLSGRITSTGAWRQQQQQRMQHGGKQHICWHGSSEYVHEVEVEQTVFNQVPANATAVERLQM